MSNSDTYKSSLLSIGNLTFENFARKQQLGALSFEPLKGQFEMLQAVIRKLVNLRLDTLPEQGIQSIYQSIQQIEKCLKRAAMFNIGTSNSPAQEQEAISADFKSYVANLLQIVGQWYFALTLEFDAESAVRDALENHLSSFIEQQNRLQQETESALDTARSKMNQFDEILQAAREASGLSAATEFANHFQREAESTRKAAYWWLGATVAICLVLGLLCAYFWRTAWITNSNNQALQLVTTKVVTLGLMVSATVWCGKIYKALMHQCTAHRHRALTLQTLNAFVHSAKDPSIKDAMLHEGAKSVFAVGSTGYIEGGASDGGDLKVLEIARSVLPTPGK